MEDDEDDFYGGGGRQESAEENEDGQHIKEEQMNDGDDGDDGEEEEEDEDDVQFTLEKPEGAKSEPARPSVRPTPSQDRKPSVDPKLSKSTPKPEPTPRQSSTAPPQPTSTPLTHQSGREGKDYPAPRTSTIDLDTPPIWPSANKPITHLDIDADLALSSKPWRQPGTDQTDFFNYGFDEYTWTQYCLKQQTMAQGISEQRKADEQMKAMFGGGPSMEEMMGMMGGGGGMPGMEQMMAMMGAGGPGGPPMPEGMGPGGFPQQGFGGSNGQNSVSPAPGAQGFQPPNQPQGYSEQQMAIMQQGGGMGGGGRGRGRRGRW